MGHLIETVFEDIDLVQVGALFRLLISDAEPMVHVRSDISGDIPASGFDAGELEEELSKGDNVCILINANSLRIASGVVENVLIRVMKYGQHYDVDFNFDIDEVRSDREGLIASLHRYAAGLASRSGARRYYAGLEPAADHAHRFFTGDQLGPVVLR